MRGVIDTAPSNRTLYRLGVVAWIALAIVLSSCASIGRQVATCKAGATDETGRRLCLYQAAVVDLESVVASQSALLDAVNAAEAAGTIGAARVLKIHRANLKASDLIAAASVALDVAIEARGIGSDPSRAVALAYEAVAALWAAFGGGSGGDGLADCVALDHGGWICENDGDLISDWWILPGGGQ